MPRDVSSPFTPGVPVPVEFFVGRRDEIERLRKKVAGAERGRLEVAFLLGERGIGKSSLASFVRFLCERERNVLGLHTFLGGVTSLEEMVRRVFDRLLKQSVDTPWYDKVKGFFGNYIQAAGLFGVSVEFRAPDRDLTRMVHDFAPALRNLADRMKDEKKSIFLVLDDINGLSSSPDFANWLKSLVDEIATSGKPLPLCLLLVGLEERRQALIELQPSLARVFDLVDIKAWSHDETCDFYRKAFSEVRVELEEKALNSLVIFTGGLPVLGHEIGDAVFAVDTDGRIDGVDAFLGVISAADIVGRKHLQPQVFQAIRSERYRAILRKVARELKFSFTRGEVLERLTQNEVGVFDNFLRRMTSLGVIVRESTGAYRFSNGLHFTYFLLEAERAKGARKGS